MVVDGVRRVLDLLLTRFHGFVGGFAGIEKSDVFQRRLVRMAEKRIAVPFERANEE